MTAAVDTRPNWVLLPGEATRRNFRNALALRRFCRRNDVVIRKVGRLEFVSPDALDRAIAGVVAPDPPSNDTVAAAFALITGRR